MKKIIIALMGFVAAFAAVVCHAELNVKDMIYKEILGGHVHITIPGEIEEDAVLDKKVQSPDGRIIMRGQYSIYLDDNETTTGTLAMEAGNFVRIGTAKNSNGYIRYLIPFAINSGGSGVFWYLGLFNADFKNHRVVLSDYLDLGDRVANIVIHADENDMWVKFKDHGTGQAMADKPEMPVTKFLTFNESLTHFTVPVPANLWNLDKQKLDPYRYPYNKDYPLLPEFWEEQFYPLGYSKDGDRFAYMIDNIGNVAGIEHIEVFVQDLKTDRILWKHELLTGEGNPENMDFDKFWKKDNKLILNALKIHGIVWSSGHLYAKDGDIRYSSDRLRYYALNKKALRDGWYDPTVVHTRIYLESEKYGKKKVHEKIYEHQSYLLDIQPLGYFPPPKEGRRAAIIIGYLFPGYEGPPNDIHYGIIGANLETGFRK